MAQTRWYFIAILHTLFHTFNITTHWLGRRGRGWGGGKGPVGTDSGQPDVVARHFRPCTHTYFPRSFAADARTRTDLLRRAPAAFCDALDPVRIFRTPRWSFPVTRGLQGCCTHGSATSQLPAPFVCQSTCRRGSFAWFAPGEVGVAGGGGAHPPCSTQPLYQRGVFLFSRCLHRPQHIAHAAHHRSCIVPP